MPLPTELNTPENRFRRNREIEDKTLRASWVLQGSSRSGWLERVMGNIVSAYDLQHLAFLTDKEDHAPYIWPDENWRYRLTALQAPEVVLAKQDIEQIMSLSRQDPQRIGDLTEDGWGGEDVVKAMSETRVAFHPQYVFGDEGCGLSYLYAFLRTCLLILEQAIEKQDVVVCYQKHPD